MGKLCSIVALLVFLTVPVESCSAFQTITPNLVKINDPVLSESGYWRHYASQSSLAGIGIRSSLQAGLSSEFDPEIMWRSVQNGLLRGITSVSLEWGAQALGLSPLIGSLTSAAIAGGIEALLEGRNPIEGIFDTYFRAGTGMLTLGGDGGNNPWLRAAYISQVLDFSRIIQERGIVNALETYAAGFLHQQTINEIWKQGGIAELLTKPNQIEITTNAKGETVKRIYTMTISF